MTKYMIRKPVRMVQLTEKNGAVLPIGFYLDDDNGEEVHVVIDRVLHVSADAEQKSGAVGDRYECMIQGRREYLYFAIVQPRKWFLLREVSKEDYEGFYRYTNKRR
jgi:hypothetical protein